MKPNYLRLISKKKAQPTLEALGQSKLDCHWSTRLGSYDKLRSSNTSDAHKEKCKSVELCTCGLDVLTVFVRELQSKEETPA